MSGPMDPERLARLRRATGPGGCAYSTLEVSDLLDSHDHHSKRADAAEAALETSRRLLHTKTAGGLRGLLDDAERERDQVRADLDSARLAAENYRARLIDREEAWAELAWNE